MNRPFPDLVHLFDQLSAPSANLGLGRFCAQPIPGYRACAIGKDASANPVLLVQAENALPGTAAPLVLEHLSVIHLVNCRIQTSDEKEHERTLSVVRCIDSDRALHEYFLGSLHPVIASLPEHPSRDHVSQAIERLVDLFRRLTDAPRKTVAGLWAELFVIARSSDPAILLDAWHSIPEEKFDFAIGGDRLEVKAASGGLRVHHFSLEQLRPVARIRILIASLLAERTQGGSSLNDLVHAIRRRVTNPDLLIRLDQLVAQTLGQDWRAMWDTRFDLQQATQSLQFIDAALIPSVAATPPPEVSAVHFRVDLTQLPLSHPERLIHESRLFRSALPRPEP